MNVLIQQPLLRKPMASVGTRKESMRRSLLRRVTLVAAFYIACVSVAAAQEEGGVPRVAVGEINGTPGSSLMVPLYFTPDPDRPLRSISVELEYISNSLEFRNAASGTAVQQIGATLNSTLTAGEPDENDLTRSRLRIDVEVPESQAEQGIPDGLLSFLMFDVSTEARPFAIRLNTTVLSAQTAETPSQTITDVSTLPGLVVVELLDMMPENTCFFFTH